jgi:hypothetical protein
MKMMNNFLKKHLHLPLFLLLVLTAFGGCKKKLTQFHIDYNMSAVIQSSVPVSSPFTINTPQTTTNSEFEFESNDTRKDRIREILLKELTLTITGPQGQTFSFLNSLEIFIDSENLPERKVAFKENIPNDVGNEITCEITVLDLQEYIKEDKFRLRIKTVTNAILTQDVHLNFYSKFLVDAQLIR